MFTSLRTLRDSKSDHAKSTPFSAILHNSLYSPTPAAPMQVLYGIRDNLTSQWARAELRPTLVVMGLSGVLNIAGGLITAFTGVSVLVRAISPPRASVKSYRRVPCSSWAVSSLVASVCPGHLLIPSG